MASAAGATGLACDAVSFATAAQQVEKASFSADKLTACRALCSSYVFAAEQVGVLLSRISFTGEKMEALELFRCHVLDPANAAPVVESFSMSSDKDAAAKLLASFPRAEVGELEVYRVEDDGHRSEAEVSRFVDSIMAQSMSDVEFWGVPENTGGPREAWLCCSAVTWLVVEVETYTNRTTL